MKKLLTLVISGILLVTLSGCQEAQELATDATNSYNNLAEGVNNVKTDVENTVEGVNNAVNTVKDTADATIETIDNVKDTAAGISEALGGGEESNE